MELERQSKQIKLVKTAPQKDSAPQTPSKPINIPPKKKLINENSPIIKRIQQAEQKASREKQGDDELIEREFENEPEVMALRAKNNATPLQKADIDDYIQQSQIPQTRNLADMGDDFIANESDILDETPTRTPLPQKEHLDSRPNMRGAGAKAQLDKMDLSDLMPQNAQKGESQNLSQNAPQNTQKKGSLGLIHDSQQENMRNIGRESIDKFNRESTRKSSESIESTRNLRSNPRDSHDSRLNAMSDFLNEMGDNHTPRIIDDFARAKNSDSIVGIYTPDPRDIDSESHHRVEFVDKIDNYDIEIPKNKVLYDDILGESAIDSTDDIDRLNEINDSLIRAQKRLEERLKIAKMRQKLGDIKSVTPIDSDSASDFSPKPSESSESADKIFIDFSNSAKNTAESTATQNVRDFRDLPHNAQNASKDSIDSPNKIDLSDLIVDKKHESNMTMVQNPRESRESHFDSHTDSHQNSRESHFDSPKNSIDSHDSHQSTDDFNENFFDLEPDNLMPPNTANQSANPSQNATQSPNQNYVMPNPHSTSDFTLPPLDLLNPPLAQKIDIDDSEIDIKVQNLFNKLRVFKIEGDIVRTYSGPVVTTFEFRPAPNVKVSRIQNLQDDLSMALKATSIRIQAPIPGKDVVGIEIPNNKIQTIYLREIFESDEYRNADANLPIALGKDVIGNPVIEDLAKLPHLLIAGTTGSGKSVGINAMILSLLYRHTPKDLRFIMIDPKFLEFGLYKDIPHLLTPIITDPKKAIIALSKAVEEMNRRYELMDKAKVKTIVGYNELVEVNGGGNQADKLPYIVIIIDEFADLMIMGGREAEQFLISLAGKARASGIHLIIATQRPTVNVVTGLIKGNLPSKISYRVGSKIDSKVILDETGAEALLGRGDLLFSKTNNIVRLHAPYNDEREIERIVEFLKAQQEVQYDEFFSLEQKEPVGTPQPTQISSEGDYKERAKEIILQSGKTSISYLQRGLGVGFNKAASIIESLEKDGFLSPPNSKGVREIIGS